MIDRYYAALALIRMNDKMNLLHRMGLPVPISEERAAYAIIHEYDEATREERNLCLSL